MSIEALNGAAAMVASAVIDSPVVDPAIPAPAAASPAPEKAPEVDISRELAMLHRERKKFEVQRKAHSEKLKKADAYEARLAKAKEDPDAYLKESGLTLDELIQRKLKEGEPLTPDEQAAALDAKVNKTIEDRLREAEDKRNKEAEQNRINEDIAIFKESVLKEIGSKPEQYETLAYYGDEGRDTVMAICAQAIAEKPEQYKDREACEALIPRVCDMLEAELFEKEKDKALKLQKLKKVFGPQDPKNDTAPAPKDISAPQATLTNSMNSPAPIPNEQPGRLLTREESIRRLAPKLQESWSARK